MDHMTYVADRLERNRAAALIREIELRRRILDRGATIIPERPAVSPLNVLGIWFRSRGGAARVRISY